MGFGVWGLGFGVWGLGWGVTCTLILGISENRGTLLGSQKHKGILLFGGVCFRGPPFSQTPILGF